MKRRSFIKTTAGASTALTLQPCIDLIKPKMTFLDHYMAYASVNESPRSYHLWSGLSLISSIVGRRVFTDMELFKVHPQMYVVLAGPPGVAKSTAMDVAKDFIKDHVKKIAICPAAITKEALVVMMAKDDKESHSQQVFNYQDKPNKFAQISIFADEIVSLIMCGGAPTVMIDFMTEIFSGKDYRETTKNKGDSEIKQPYLTLLACCTIETLKQLVNQRVVSGGMSRRCVFVVERENSKPVPFIHYTNEQLDSRRYCRDNWTKLQNLCGPFEWSDEALIYYRGWYSDNFYRAQSCQSEVLQHFLRTKPVYCIKVSMLLAISSDTPKLEHSLESFQRAVEIVTSVEDGASRLFDSQGRNELASFVPEIEKWFENKVGKVIKYKDIYRDFYRICKDGNTAQIDSILDQLQREGKLELSSSYDGGASVRTATWKGTKQ